MSGIVITSDSGVQYTLLAGMVLRDERIARLISAEQCRILIREILRKSPDAAGIERRVSVNCVWCESENRFMRADLLADSPEVLRHFQRALDELPIEEERRRVDLSSVLPMLLRPTGGARHG